MPNWVKNIVHAYKSDTDFEKFVGDEGRFTFEKIIPMPDNIFRGAIGSAEKEKYGKDNWYDWSLAHWGTKWDACEPEVNGATVMFETAWSCPLPVLRELAKKVGGIVVMYADEGDYENTGCLLINGKGRVEDLGGGAVIYLTVYSRGDVEDREDVISEFDWFFEREDEDDE